jgi:hypothetical protein
MGYLLCKECGGIYELQEGESPDDFDVCYCGGEIEYHLSRDELYERQTHVPTAEETVRQRSSDRNLIIIIIIGVVFISVIPIAIAALFIYRAYFSGSGALILEQMAISATMIFLGGI